MQRKDPPPGSPEVDAASANPAELPNPDTATRSRRRFGEGETVVMRLDELLRTRPSRSSGSGGGARDGGGEKTQVVSVADLQINLAHQTERTIQNARLSDSQVALLQRTEPRASAQHSRSISHANKDIASATPAPPGAEVGVWGSPPPQPAAPSPSRAPQAADEPEPAGVATRIGPPPSSHDRQGASRGASAKAPPATHSRHDPTPSTPSPWRPRELPEVSTAAAVAPSERTRALPPPLPPAHVQAAADREAEARAVSSRAVPPPLPRSAGREAKTDPGIVLPKGLVKPPTQTAVEDALSEAGRAPVPFAPATPASARVKRRVANQVVVVFSCKGGSGATALAANAAYAAVQGQQSACVLDLDLQLGDALAAFGLAPRFGIAQAVHLQSERQQLSRSLLPSHTSGVHVLSQVGNLNDLEKITPESMSALLLSLRQHFDTVVVDGVRDFGDNVLAMLDGADKVALVCVQEVLAIRRARWTFSILRKIGFEATDLTLIVNNYSEANEIPLSSISSMFEGAQVLPLPGDASLVTQSLNRGMPLAELRPDHPLVAGMERLCSHIFYGDAVEVEPMGSAATPGGSFLQRIFTKGKAPRQPA